MVETAQDNYVRIGEFELTPDGLIDSSTGETVKLQAQPLRLLRLLASKPGKEISHDEIRLYLWGDQQVDHSGSIHVCIRQIRTALNDSGDSPKFIENIPRRGYRLRPSISTSSRSITRASNGSRNSYLPAFGAIVAMLIVGAILYLMDRPELDSTPEKVSQSPAEDLLKRGRYLLDKLTEESISDSRRFFQLAIEKDPSFAPAYSAMAESFQRAESFENARTYAEKAIELDPHFADAHLRLGSVQFFQDWNWAAAEKRMAEALTLNADFVEAHQAIATVFAITGRQELALEHMKSALTLDPASTLLSADYGFFLYYAGLYAEAKHQCRDALELDASHSGARLCLIKAARKSGDIQLAVEHAVAHMLALNADHTTITRLARSDPDGALQAFYRWRVAAAEERIKVSDTSVPPESLALIYVTAGEEESALTQLQRAFELRRSLLPIVLIDPELSPLYDEPGFRALVSEVNVTVPSSSRHAAQQSI